MSKKLKTVLLVAGVFLFLTSLTVAIPGIRDRLSWRVEQLRTRVYYSLFPPEEAIFSPNETLLAAAVNAQATEQVATALANIAPTLTPVPENLNDPLSTPTPTPLPSGVTLTGVRYEDQHGLWNYCAPATLSMALSFWGWQGDRVIAGQGLKPFEKDKNVMPYEMQTFVEEETDLKAVVRYGGTIELLKSLIAGGFPVVVEKGAYIRETTTGKVSWMGHYNLFTGYDDGIKQIIAQDSYYSPDYPIDYSLLQDEWRAFNYVFLVIYPPDKEERLLALLGDYADPVNSNKIAAQIAVDEFPYLDGVDKFFALFNRGTSLVNLQDYGGGALAYDEAFKLYPSLEKDLRPYRIMWYQTGPYFAYYYTGRYADVVELATTTLDSALEPYLEENFYWRARAKAALGDIQGAVDDLRTSLKYHPDFLPSLQVLQEMGYSP